MEMSAEGSPGRRSFLSRSCLAGAGACACFLGVPAAGAAAVAPGSAAQEPTGLSRAWIARLLDGLDGATPAVARELLRPCAAAHYEALGMDAVLAPFAGDLPGFLGFLRSEWGWIVEHGAEAGVVLANENKDRCVCPLLTAEATGGLSTADGAASGLGVLCYCSEGFASRMFSVVTGAPATAEVTESILRGGVRCRYRIEVEAGAAPT